MYLASWKGNLPAGEVHALPAGRQPFQSTRYMPRRLEGPCRLEGNPSSRPLVLGIPGDTRISAGIWGGERTSASPGGYPLALADIRQRIADIRNGLSPPISSSGPASFLVRDNLAMHSWTGWWSPRNTKDRQVLVRPPAGATRGIHGEKRCRCWNSGSAQTQSVAGKPPHREPKNFKSQKFVEWWKMGFKE
ncbi:hypothetical protein PGTUg99_029069 [Puccinia graminis f. sp. tritici]|uniref:Uncharacterized protein n=1 Tax=Puccinia graminis f. sp. tritici TaxID=56615 RepID=A0A5B0SJE4_PUCGR|nr:hypothetical protein PGTUg99_029069 [Puccinia graminis f. sp. tritici]